MPDERYEERRKRTLTDADLEHLREIFICNGCSFTHEEVQFVKDWLETAKTAKSEIIKFVVKGIVYGIGIVSGLIVATKMGWLKLFGK